MSDTNPELSRRTFFQLVYENSNHELRNLEPVVLPEHSTEDQKIHSENMADGDALIKTRSKIVGGVALGGTVGGVIINVKSGAGDVVNGLIGPAVVYGSNTWAFNNGIKSLRSSPSEEYYEIGTKKNLRKRSQKIALVAGLLSLSVDYARNGLTTGDWSSIPDEPLGHWVIPAIMQTLNYRATLTGMNLMLDIRKGRNTNQ